ncbi:MAG: hypothetical protein IPK82_42590 [Polyangiaceae bacterium]|nr:hypothetical protein [Polyangiaceae bacterium]
MRTSWLALVLPIIVLAGCDGGSTSGSGGSGGQGGSGATGGSTGGSNTGGSTGGSNTGGGTTTTTTTTTTSTTTTTTGTGGAGMGACTNDADLAIVQDPNKPIADAVNDCAQMNFGQEPGTLNCIKGLGLSDGCAQCFDDTVQCVVMNCLNQCLSDPNSQACTDCRAQFCDGPFAMCSGLMP